MNLFNNNRIGPIGLDLGHDSIKMIQLSRCGEIISVLAAEEEQFPPDIEAQTPEREEFIISTVRQMLSRGNFSGRDVVSCLSNDDVTIKSLRLDVSEYQEHEETDLVLEEFSQRFGFDPENDEVRHINAGTVRQGEDLKHEMMLFTTPKDTINKYIDMLESCGFLPVAIDVVPCALFRCIQRSFRREEDKDLASVFIDVASRFTTVTIGSARQITFTKQIPIAGQYLNQNIAQRLGIEPSEAMVLRAKLRNPRTRDTIQESTLEALTDAMNEVFEELAREISMCFRYYAITFRGQRPCEAIFAGEEAYESSLLEALKRHLGLDIQIAQPLRGIDLSKANFVRGEQASLCEWAVAVGLSIKGWQLPLVKSG